MAWHRNALLLHPWMLKAVSRRTRTTHGAHPCCEGELCLLRVENPAESSLLILAGGRASKPCVDRAGIHNGLHSYLLSCRNYLSLQRAPIESTQASCSRLQQRGGAASGWSGRVGTHGGFRRVRAKAKLRIPCALGGNE